MNAYECAACGAAHVKPYARLWWRTYQICGECFAERSSEELAEMCGEER